MAQPPKPKTRNADATRVSWVQYFEDPWPLALTGQAAAAAAAADKTKMAVYWPGRCRKKW